MTMLRIQVLNKVSPCDVVYLNVEAIDSIYVDKPGLYGVLLSSGVIYHFDKATYERLIKYFKDERL